MLNDKVVIITGASSGIGAEMAKQLAAAGAVPVLLARSAEKLNAVAGQIGTKHDAYSVDVTSTEQVFAAVEAIYEKYGRIDALINNAGYGEFEAFADMPIEKFTTMMDVNYFGTVRCTKAVLPYMLQAGKGHIINIASMAGKIGSPKTTAYAATKHAVLGFTNSLRQELMGTGIQISAVNPGPIDTPFFDRADPSGSYVNNVRWFMLKPERVAKETVKLLSTGKAEKDLPVTAFLGVKVYQLFPRLFDRVAHKLLNQK